jgi:hypothetical protein
MDMEKEIQLLQFLVCREFTPGQNDSYTAEGMHSNVYVPRFPHTFELTYAVTCWRKDKKFHKEVIEYETDYGKKMRSPHMDIEPVTNSVLFRWHKHQFPPDLTIDKPSILTVRVILDWKVMFESYLMIEQAP